MNTGVPPATLMLPRLVCCGSFFVAGTVDNGAEIHPLAPSRWRRAVAKDLVNQPVNELLGHFETAR